MISRVSAYLFKDVVILLILVKTQFNDDSQWVRRLYLCPNHPNLSGD